MRISHVSGSLYCQRPLFKCQMAWLVERSIKSCVLGQLIMSVIEMISSMSKMAIRFMKSISCQIHFITKDMEIDNFYYCAAL